MCDGQICWVQSLPRPNFAMAAPMEAIVYNDKKYNAGTELTIQFLDFTTKEKDFVLEAANKWTEHANLKFTPVNGWDNADIRIQQHPGLGSWSYLGTDNMFVGPGGATLNLGWLASDMQRNDISTVLHEFGHGALAMPHEHQNPYEPIPWDRQKVYDKYSGAPNYWDKTKIDHNILNVLSTEGISATRLDRFSIMAYFFDGSLTTTGVGMPRNTQLSDVDKAFAAKQYPYPNVPTEPTEPETINIELRRFLQHYFMNQLYIERATKAQLLICLGWLSVPADPFSRKGELIKLLQSEIKKK